jgi:hypothetical protein
MEIVDMFLKLLLLTDSIQHAVYVCVCVHVCIYIIYTVFF